MSIGKVLQKVRQDCHLTQQEVANKLYVTRQTVSRWEQDKTMPNIYALQDLAELYGVSLDDLVGTHLQNPEGKEGSQMKKINWLALFGFFWFNVIVVLGVVLAAIGVLAGLWVSIVSFVLAPGLLAGEWLLIHINILTTHTSIGWYQIPIAGLLFIVGVVGIPMVKNLTFYLMQYFKKYLRYNMHMLYYED